jgi:hypothetical protein
MKSSTRSYQLTNSCSDLLSSWLIDIKKCCVKKYKAVYSTPGIQLTSIKLIFLTKAKTAQSTLSLDSEFQTCILYVHHKK